MSVRFRNDREFAFRQFAGQVFDHDFRAFRQQFIILFIDKGKGDDAEVDEVGGMDAFDGIGDHGFDAQIHGTDRRMFAGGTLPVTVAADDDAVTAGIPDCGGPLGKSRFAFFVEALENDLGIFRNIAPVFQVDPGRHDIVRAGLVAGADDHGALDRFRHGLVDRRTADGLLADDLDVLTAAGRPDQHGIVDQEFFRIFHLRIGEAERGRIGDLTGQGGGCGDFRAYQVVLVPLGAGASGEIPVERAERHGVVGGTLSLSDAGTATGFENAGSGGNDVGQRAVAGEHFQDLTAARCNGERHIRTDLASFEHGADDHQVAVRTVGAGTDDNLTDRHAGQFGD